MCESGTGSVLFVLFYLSHQGKCVWQWYKSMGGKRVGSASGGPGLGSGGSTVATHMQSSTPVHRYQQRPRGQTRRQSEVKI